MFTNSEDGFSITENRTASFQNFSKGSSFEEINFSTWMLRPIAKQVLFSRMPMEVKIKIDTTVI